MKNKFISHEEYDKNNPDSKFDFGRIESDKLISSRYSSIIFKPQKESFFKKVLRKIKGKEITTLPSGFSTHSSSANISSDTPQKNNIRVIPTVETIGTHDFESTTENKNISENGKEERD